MTEASKSDLTRSRILDAGRSLLLRHGFSGVGLSRILAESGVPKGSFYYYFPSKEAFGAALLQDYVEGYTERVDALIARPETAGEKLNLFWNAWLAEGDQPGIATECLVIKLGAEVADLSDTMREILDSGVNALVDRLAQLLREGEQDGSVRAFEDPETTARMLYAKWVGAAVLAKLAQSDAPLRMAKDEATKHLSPLGNTSS